MAKGPEEFLFQKYAIKIGHLSSKENLKFKAFLTQFEDQYVSDWNTELLFGRMDPIKSFRGTARTISLGFDVLANDLKEAQDNLTNCSKFLSMLYPGYEGTANNTPQEEEPVVPPVPDTATDVPGQSANDTNSEAEEKKATQSNADRPPQASAAKIQSAPLFRIQFVNLIHNQGSSGAGSSEDKTTTQAMTDGLIGVIDGLTYSPDIEQGFFDPEGGNLYPQTIKLSFGFAVTHDHPLGWAGNQWRNGKTFPY